jgi:serine/threonine protein kinase
MSPEQAAGDREIDGRSDLYSLGTVAYQMLTGQPPFAGGNTPAIMMKQVTEKPVPVTERAADVPPDLAAIVMRLLEKAPGHRFATGQDVVAALNGAPVEALAPRRDDIPKYVMDVEGIGGHAVPPVAANSPLLAIVTTVAPRCRPTDVSDFPSPNCHQRTVPDPSTVTASVLFASPLFVSMPNPPRRICGRNSLRNCHTYKSSYPPATRTS